MARRMLSLLAVLAAAGGCGTLVTECGFEVRARDEALAPPGMVVRGPDDAYRLDRRSDESRIAKGELEFEGTPAEVVIEELLARCEGLRFFGASGEVRETLEGVLITAKAGSIEKDMVFPYLRAVFQMNGLDLVPVEIPFYGEGFRVVKLEDFDWRAPASR